MTTLPSVQSGNPPPGIDLTENQERTNDVVVGIMVFLATAAVGHRLAIRKRMKQALDVDDWLIVAALLGNYSSVVCTFVSGHFGLGRHVWACSPASLRLMAKALYAYPFCYALGATCLKLSFWWTYARLFRFGPPSWDILKCKTSIDKSLVVCGVLTVIYPFTLWFPMLGICQPVNFFWDQYTGATDGKCLNHLVLWIFAGTFSALLDFMILIIPIPTIYGLQMSRLKKFGVLGILALGSFVFIASTMRIIYMVRMLHTKDLTWALGPAAIWTAVEPSLGIVSACLIVTFKVTVASLRRSLGLLDHSTDIETARQTHRKTFFEPDNRHKSGRCVGHLTEEEDESYLMPLGDKNTTTSTVMAQRLSYSSENEREGVIKVHTSITVNQGPGSGV